MRVRRGFHRIGVVGLAPLAALALLLAAVAAYSGAANPDYRPMLAGSVGLLACGALWYVVFWALGWIIAGFRGE